MTELIGNGTLEAGTGNCRDFQPHPEFDTPTELDSQLEGQVEELARIIIDFYLEWKQQ